MKTQGIMRTCVLVVICSLAATRLSAFKHWVVPEQQVGDRLCTVCGFIHWDQGVTIDVYIPADPDKLDRDEAAREAFEAWKDALEAETQANLSFNFHEGNPPQDEPPPHVVTISWKAARGEHGLTNLQWDLQPTEKEDEWEQGANIGATIDINRWRSGPDDPWCKTALYNVVLHEVGHLLGLDHKTEGQDSEIMGPTGNADPNNRIPLKEDDIKGLQAIYGSKTTGQASGEVKGDAVPDESYRYEYRLRWLAGAAIALFEIDTSGATIERIVTPPGWFAEPYYSRLGVLVFRADTKPLDQENSEAMISFVSPSAPIQDAFYSFAGQCGSITGPDAPTLVEIPTLSKFGLILFIVAFLLLGQRILRRNNLLGCLRS